MKTKLNFIHDLSVSVVSAAVAAGTTTVTTDVINMQGFDSVAIIAMLGDVTDTSVLTLTAQAGDESDGSDAADLAASATFTAGAADADSKLMIVDLTRPRQQYVRATLDRATANAVVNGVIAVLYNAHEFPVAIDADVIASTLVNDPALA